MVLTTQSGDSYPIDLLGRVTNDDSQQEPKNRPSQKQSRAIGLVKSSDWSLHPLIFNNDSTVRSDNEWRH